MRENPDTEQRAARLIRQAVASGAIDRHEPIDVSFEHAPGCPRLHGGDCACVPTVIAAGLALSDDGGVLAHLGGRAPRRVLQ
jgi:ABC-type nitrate/sulfonate/bicarbonate transport system substrate-binding protein